MDIYTLISISAYFIAMLAIGLYAYRNTETDVEGYLLGGRQLSPAVTALSAGASDMSGWILMGLPGAMYINGLSSAWIAIGLVIGAYFNYLIVAPRLRRFSELANDAVTIPDYLSNRLKPEGKSLRAVAAVVVIIFFTLYTSAGLVAGGKLFESAFGQSYELGILLTVGVVVIYTLIGGFLAVSMTDFVQGCIMLVALIVVPMVALFDVQDLSASLTSIDPSMLSLTSNLGIMAIISSMAWGLGYFGQPHIIVRFMAIRSVEDIPTARRIGISWMIISVSGALLVGLVGRAYVMQHDLTLTDPETIFILLSQIMFHPLVAGILLSAILAAIMSTISSQLLVSASSLSEDLYHRLFKREASQREVVIVGRAAVLGVSAVAAYLALNPDETILGLVANAWAGFGAAFGPVIILSLVWSKLTYHGAVSAMIAGAVTVLWWSSSSLTINDQSLSSWLYEIVPGFVVAMLVALIVSRFTAQPSHNIDHFFSVR